MKQLNSYELKRRIIQIGKEIRAGRIPQLQMLSSREDAEHEAGMRLAFTWVYDTGLSLKSGPHWSRQDPE